MLSPFLYQKDDMGPGITGISTFQLQFNFATGDLLNRMLCLNNTNLKNLVPPVNVYNADNTNNITLTAKINNGSNGGSSLHCTFLSPAVDMAMPPITFYPYY